MASDARMVPSVPGSRARPSRSLTALKRDELLIQDCLTSDKGDIQTDIHFHVDVLCIAKKVGARFTARPCRHAALRAKGNDTSHQTVIQLSTLKIRAEPCYGI